MIYNVHNNIIDVVMYTIIDMLTNKPIIRFEFLNTLLQDRTLYHPSDIYWIVLYGAEPECEFAKAVTKSFFGYWA